MAINTNLKRVDKYYHGMSKVMENENKTFAFKPNDTRIFGRYSPDAENMVIISGILPIDSDGEVVIEHPDDFRFTSIPASGQFNIGNETNFYYDEPDGNEYHTLKQEWDTYNPNGPFNHHQYPPMKVNADGNIVADRSVYSTSSTILILLDGSLFGIKKIQEVFFMYKQSVIKFGGHLLFK